LKRPYKSRENSRLVFIAGAAFAIAALYFARIVFIPLALASLFALLLNPAVAFLERIKIPRILSVLIVVFSLLGILGVVGWKTSQQFMYVAGQLPAYRETLTSKIRAIKGLQNPNLDKASDTVDQLAKEIGKSTPATPPPSRQPLGSSPSKPLVVEQVLHPNPFSTAVETLSPLASAALVTLFTIFIIMGREDLRNRFIRLAAGGRLLVMTQAINEASTRVNRYLFLQLVVNAAYGALIGTVLYFIGIPSPWLWGACAGLFRFVPFVGPPLSAIAPIVLSLAIFPGWHHAILTAGVFLILEVTVANFVEPFLYGAHVGLTPLAILVAATFWTLLWGLPGLLLSTPLTVCLVVMGRYVPALSFLNVLLGDEPPMLPPAQFYQRLLASDLGEAREVLEENRKEKSLEEFYSSILLPALVLVEEDRHSGDLDEELESYIYQSTRELIEEFETASAPPRNGEPISGVASFDAGNILCVPARDDADEVAGTMLAHVLHSSGCNARSIPLGTTAELLAEITTTKPARVLISALPPFAVDHARWLYTKLHAHSPRLQIDICLWLYEGDLTKVSTRLGLQPGHRLYTTLAQVTADVTATSLETTSAD